MGIGQLTDIASIRIAVSPGKSFTTVWFERSGTVLLQAVGEVIGPGACVVGTIGIDEGENTVFSAASLAP